jgi:2-desacetyl-2-hydroxyethyl bacteriochlorophyllide A dehydrogenase
MPSLDAICLRLTGQTLEVVQHQLMAIRANVWSWLLVTLKIRKPRLQLDDCDSKARCIVVLSPGGPERLEFWPLDDGLATVGYNVPESVAPRDPRSRSLTRVATPPPGLVVVRITHFSVNYADVTIRWGLYESAIKFVGYPIVPGFDFSGIVEAVGDGVDNLRAGDAVFGITFFGAYSSRLLVPASQCRKTPRALSAAEAAALPSVAGTALHAMALAQFWPSAPPTRNRAVLVHSAAGGVGSMLVQMAKTLGCGPVVGVVGAPHKVEACEACGADTVVCKAGRSDWWDDVAAASPDGYAAIFDANGVATLRSSYDALAQTGRLVIFGFHTNLPTVSSTLSPLHWLRMAKGIASMPAFEPMDLVLSSKSIHGFNLSFACGVPSRGLRVDGAVVNA